MLEGLNRLEPYAYALLRIVAGFMFFLHGLQKIFGMAGGQGPVEIMSMRGAAGLIELIGGALIMIGLLTRLAAFISSGEMAAAWFIAHMPQGINPLTNGGELAALYCFVFLFIAARGAGNFSIDGAMGNSRRKGGR